uniref:General transcription factor IIA, 1 n=1 Tax=Nothobranchius furzeri TaxID=105023 RepID=A0A8C6KHI1_NOTFU
RVNATRLNSPKLYRSVIEDVMSEVRELFLDEGVDEQVLHELKTLWENKLLQSKAVEGFHSDEQAALQASQQQQQQHIQHVQQVTQPAQTQQVILPPQQQQQAPQQQVIVRDPKLLQHMSATGMSAAATAATLALPTGVTPYQQIITQQGQILQVVRAPNGAQYIIQQSQQPIVLQQPMQSGGVQAPVIQQVPEATLSSPGVNPNTQAESLGANKKPTPALRLSPGATPAKESVQPLSRTWVPEPMLCVEVSPTISSRYCSTSATSSCSFPASEVTFHEPLNSGDDVSDDDGGELFDTENVVVCQYDKIHRSKNKWKFHLKDGIMNLNGRDYVFSKAIGDAEW